MTTVHIVANAVKAKVIDPDRPVKLLISELLSYQVDGYQYTDAGKESGWSGMSSFFSIVKCTFPSGFLRFVTQELTKNGYQVRISAKELPEPLGPKEPKVGDYEEDPRYDYQMQTVRRLESRGRMVAQISTGGGKCLGEGTKVLMFDGTVKNVEDVKIGDRLIGPDSKPRNVLSICSGTEPLYKVVQKNGKKGSTDSYIVNKSHILSLQMTDTIANHLQFSNESNVSKANWLKIKIIKETVDKYCEFSEGSKNTLNISVADYVSKASDKFKKGTKGWRIGVDFENSGEKLPINPYILGLWLGSGKNDDGAEISLPVHSTEVFPELISFHKLNGETTEREFFTKHKSCTKRGGDVRFKVKLTPVGKGGCESVFKSALRDLGVLSNKHIPHIYKVANKEDRLNLLAGIIDARAIRYSNHYIVGIRSEKLAYDILFLAKSLGLIAMASLEEIKIVRSKRISLSKKEKSKTFKEQCDQQRLEYVLSLSGGNSRIPCRISKKVNDPENKLDGTYKPSVSSISVRPIGEGKYYGFEIDGDGLFLLDSFIVTHNTRCAMLSYARINRMTLFLTTRGVLMYQMQRAFEENGEKVGIIGAGDLIVHKGFNVGMVQTLTAMLRDPRRVEKTKELLSRFEFVILEEAHEISGDGYYEILNHCVNAHYRLALTATPFMKESDESNMRLHAAVGGVGIKVSEKTLIDREILAKPYFKYLNVEKPPLLRKTTQWASAYRIGIVENKNRNAAIIMEAQRAVAHNLTVMILVQQKSHGNALNKALKANGIKSQFVNGDHSQIERQTALTRLKKGKLQVLIGSTILDVGVDVPSVGMIILAGAGKAEVALRQRIGRGLRAKKGSANVAFIVDFNDSDNKHLKEHAKLRRLIVESTPGFVEGILKEGEDFDFSLLKGNK